MILSTVNFNIFLGVMYGLYAYNAKSEAAIDGDSCGKWLNETLPLLLSSLSSGLEEKTKNIQPEEEARLQYS